MSSASRYLYNTSSAVNFSPIDVPGTPLSLARSGRGRHYLSLEAGSLNEQRRNSLASYGSLQFLFHSRVLKGMVHHFHRGAADQRRRKVRANPEIPVSQASMGQSMHSSPLGCLPGPGNCRWAYIRVPMPPPTSPLSKEAIANQSLCFSFQSLQDPSSHYRW